MTETQQEIQWFIQITDGKKAGPISWERLKNFVEQKKVLPNTKVRNTLPDSVWVSAETVPNLFADTEEMFATQINSAELTVVAKNSGENSKPSEKKESSATSFSINTGTEPNKTNIAAKPAFKINTQKSVPKENQEEKKKTGLFGFVVPKAKTTTEEKKNDTEKINVPAKISEPDKKKLSEHSTPAIKISINPPKEKNKNKEKSSAPEIFTVSTGTTPEKTISNEELPQDVASESNESDPTVAGTPEPSEITGTTVAGINSKKHGKTKEIPVFPKRKTGIISLLLITLAVFSVLIGGVGGIGVFLLGYYKQLAVLSATLGIIIFLFGIILGAVSWFLALLFSQSEP